MKKESSNHTTTTVKCAKCGRSGTAQVSTDDENRLKSGDFLIHKLPEGFVMTKQGGWEPETAVMCIKCASQRR